MILSCSLFFISSSQDEKNQVLTTNIWLQMVSSETKHVLFSPLVFEFNLVRGLNFRNLSSFCFISCYIVDKAKLNGKL